MIHITKNKHGQFQVIITAANGEPLSTSEALSSKPKAWKNIAATRKEFIGMEKICCAVQDDTLPKQKLYWLMPDGRKDANDNGVHPKYIPGKNKKKK